MGKTDVHGKLQNSHFALYYPVGMGPKPVGAAQTSVGVGQHPVGTPQKCVGAGQSCVGMSQVAVGRGQHCVGVGQNPEGWGIDLCSSMENRESCTVHDNMTTLSRPVYSYGVK